MKLVYLIMFVFIVISCEQGGGSSSSPISKPRIDTSFKSSILLNLKVKHFEVSSNRVMYSPDLNNENDSNHGLYISTDGGNSFIKKDSSNGMPHNYVGAFASQGNVIIVANNYIGATKGVSISTNSGTSFVDITGNLLNANKNFFAFDSTGTIYAVGDGGLERSNDNGGTFTKVSNFTSKIFIDSSDSIFQLNSNVMHKSTNKGDSWISVTPMNNKYHANLTSVVVDSDNNIYATYQGAGFDGDTRPLGGVIASFDNGLHFQYIEAPFEFTKLKLHSSGSLCGVTGSGQRLDMSSVGKPGLYCTKDLKNWEKVSGSYYLVNDYFWHNDDLYINGLDKIAKFTGDLPSVIGTTLTENHIASKKLSELPAGTYTRLYGEITGRSGEIILKTRSENSNVTLESFSGTIDNMLSYSNDEPKTISISAGLDIDFINYERTTSSMNYDFDFSGSNVTEIVQTDSYTRTEVLTAEGTTTKIWIDYIWINASTLKAVKSYRVGGEPNGFYFMVNTYYSYTP